MAIPIANLYYLLCYAWDEIALDQTVRIGFDECPDANHLFARILIQGIHLLRTRGLETSYVTFEEATRSPRGRILMTQSLPLLAAGGGRLFCGFDEMSPDIPTNRILKTTVLELASDDTLEKGLRAQLRASGELLAGVTTVPLTARVFDQVQLHPNNRLYRVLMVVCRWLFEARVANERSGAHRFRDVLRDEPRMRRIFEKFVRNFFVRRPGGAASISAEYMKWEADPLQGSDSGFLPGMLTDVTLRYPDRTVVIECKYTDCLVTGQFLNQTLKSQHLYQLSAYLRNLEYRKAPDCTAEGILLYPSTGASFDQAYLLHGHRVRVLTLDLTKSPEQISEQMVSISAPLAPCMSNISTFFRAVSTPS
jgi:5-methylcytosine-specific restriction enzyme subunit McrC